MNSLMTSSKTEPAKKVTSGFILGSLLETEGEECKRKGLEIPLFRHGILVWQEKNSSGDAEAESTRFAKGDEVCSNAYDHVAHVRTAVRCVLYFSDSYCPTIVFNVLTSFHQDWI